MEEAIGKVVENGYCIGCGVCSVVDPNYKIVLNNLGQYTVNHKEENLKKSNKHISTVCPFSTEAQNEDEISKELYPKLENDPLLGRVSKSYFGYSRDYRIKGASGGLTTWFLQKLITEKVVDGVIHLKESDAGNKKEGVLLKYAISNTVSEVLEGAKTKYYPGELSEVFKTILNEGNDKKYAVVGVPCFIKATRLLAKTSPIIRRKVSMYVGLICGHYKSTHYAAMLAMQKKINSGQIEKIDFRHKPGYGNAGDYHTKIDYKSEGNFGVVNESVKKFYGTDWGLGLFKYNACDYCDDVVGETADVAFGDAWINPYTSEHKGTNVVVIRDEAVVDIFDQAIQNEEIVLETASKKQVIQTQLSGFRHRREGLSLRLHLKRKSKSWVPTKRVLPSNKIGFKYQVIFRLRTLLTKRSNHFFLYAQRYNSFLLFKILMFPYVFLYKDIIYGLAKFKMKVVFFVKGKTDL